ncbi:MAG: hypothetical protein EA425_10125 [Puniceicoccaceae bacterium]|nr:MAG: hypothetical protein EA425_10125 [Puniceicoccaceae bacterium]
MSEPVMIKQKPITPAQINPAVLDHERRLCDSARRVYNRRGNRELIRLLWQVAEIDKRFGFPVLQHRSGLN